MYLNETKQEAHVPCMYGQQRSHERKRRKQGQADRSRHCWIYTLFQVSASVIFA